MDKFTVQKPFKSARCKFAKDTEIMRGDDIHPHDFDDLCKRGFITKPAVEPIDPIVMPMPGDA